MEDDSCNQQFAKSYGRWLMQSNSLQVSNVVDQIENCSGKRIACDLKEAIESGI